MIKENVSGETIKINISAENTDDGGCVMYFSIKKDVAELAGLIVKKEPLLTTEIYQDRLILIRKNSSIFLIERCV